MLRTQDLHVKQVVRLSTPRALKEALPASAAALATVVRGREAIRNILTMSMAPWSTRAD
jgi:3-deoxy-7-phosphoheptulonate synthase